MPVLLKCSGFLDLRTQAQLSVTAGCDGFDGHSRTDGDGRYQRCEMDPMQGCEIFARLIVLPL
jgi:hypothetical protein